MPKVPKGPPPDELVQLRDALAANLRMCIAMKYKGVAETTAAQAIGKATGIGKNTVLRALGKGTEESDIRLDTLVKLALHFDLDAQDLIRSHSSAGGISARSSKHKSHTARDERKEAEIDRAPLRRARGS